MMKSYQQLGVKGSVHVSNAFCYGFGLFLDPVGKVVESPSKRLFVVEIEHLNRMLAFLHTSTAPT